MKIEQLTEADIVVSLNGRDAGKVFLVIKTEGEYVHIADGKTRKYEKPKRKKGKHVKFEAKAHGMISEKLAEGTKVTNNEIRRYMAEYKVRKGGEGDMQECQKTT